ncbi:MAG: hypothetical protein NVSMB64_00030 [Candidatus Velthaea sp.]
MLVVIYQRWNWNCEQLPSEISFWNRQFMCQRCGWIGVPTATVAREQPVIEAVAPAALPDKQIRRVKRYNRK